MNTREMFLKTILFEKPDRIPLTPGGGRRSTRARWHKEGLPEGTTDIPRYAYQEAGGKLEWLPYGPAAGEEEGLVFGYDQLMIPQFEEKVIERKERSQIVQDWKGNICEISNEFTTEYLRRAIDFVTRSWVKCPVESRADWEDMKRRYDPDDPARLGKNPEKVAAVLKERVWPITFHFSGPFWQLREWCGFEQLCMMFHDDPDFVRDMVYFWQEFVAQMLEKILGYLTPDMVHLSEDMAYKCFSMISPAMAREFLLPTYKRWGDIARKAGVPVYGMDSDGFIGELIPIWMEAGVNCCDPIEVAAGNDIVAFRKEFGGDMAYQGGIDKRAIAAGGKTIEDEVKRVTPVIESGGYVPGCDHGVPHDISWPNFVHYTKLLAEVTGWM